MKIGNNILLWIWTTVIIGIASHFYLPFRIYASTTNQDDVTTIPFEMSLLYWAIGVIGGCILITLSYVGYRKYKGEKKRDKQYETKDE